MMVLYVFETCGGSNPRMGVSEYEVEEKAKTYVGEGRRFSKADVGRASGYRNEECILLERNPAKAAEILLKERELELQVLERSVAKKKAEIENLKQYLV